MGLRHTRLPEKLTAARFQFVRNWPYLSSALWALVPVEVTPEEIEGKRGAAFNTLAVDQYWRLYFCPQAVARWNVDELAAVLFHEVNHLLRDHAGRGKNRNAHPRIWNCAGDLEINDDLKQQKVKLPDGGLYPHLFEFPESELAEQYYNRLLEDAQVIVFGDDEDGEGSGDGKGDGKGSGSGAGSGKGKGRKRITVAVVPSGGYCGSCADGQARPWEDGEPRSDGDGVSHGEGELIRNHIAKEVQEQAKKSRGNIPSGLERWASERLTPKVDWRNEVRALARRSVSYATGQVDFSYSRPSRRQTCLPQVVMPAMRRPLPELALVIDTSGSMGSDEIGQAVAEVRGVLQQLGLDNGVKVYSVDAAVHTAQKVFRPEQITLAGGGGTDMTVGIDAAYAATPTPNACIVLTDGWTPWPQENRYGRMAVFAAIISEHRTEPEHWLVPGWINKVMIPIGAFKE